MSLRPTKKRKVDSKSSSSKSSVISRLETQVTEAIEAGDSLNALLELQEYTTKQEDPAKKHQGIWAIYRIHSRLIDMARLFGKVGTADANVVREWLLARFIEYSDLLLSLLHHSESQIRRSSLQLLMELLKKCSAAISKTHGQPQIYMTLWRKLSSQLLIPACAEHPDVADLFQKNWLDVYDDIRWFFLRAATYTLNSGDLSHETVQVALGHMESISRFPTAGPQVKSFWITPFSTKPASAPTEAQENEEAVEDDWRMAFREEDENHIAPSVSSLPKAARASELSTHQALHSVTSHQAHFTNCWFALLPLIQRDENMVSRTLTILPRNVIPHLTRPTRLHDWVAGTVQFGGAVGLLALNALFILMTQHNLDYPQFYTQLYSFLNRDLFHLKYRSRFFRMTELFLSSTHLPANLVASFVKRLSRLSLSAPPASILLIIPFTYNLMKKHPTLMPLIHRLPDQESAIDPFDENEKEPATTKALESSLWELASQKHHYHSTVATMALIFEDKFTKPQYALEDFLDQTYSTLFAAELKRKFSASPSVALEPPTKRLSNGGSQPSPAPVPDIIAELWSLGPAPSDGDTREEAALE